MSQFDDREKSFEAKFAHDETVQFKVFARRNKLVGLWAAGKMGLHGAKADDYAMEVVKSAATSAEGESVFTKLSADLAARKVDVSEHQIRREMDDQMNVARQQIMTETN